MINLSHNTDFYEALLLAYYALKTALVQISVLDKSSIKILQSIPKYENDIILLLGCMETAGTLLSEARESVKGLINQSVVGES